jgi:hypothetical protein
MWIRTRNRLTLKSVYSYIYASNAPRPTTIPPGIPAALKIQVQATQRSKELNHILGGRRMRGPEDGTASSSRLAA